MATDTPTSTPTLGHLQTLQHPAGNIRSWSSRPHPSSRTPLLATASSDRSVQIWNLKDFKLVSTIAGGHKRSIRCVGWKDWGVSEHPNTSSDDNERGDSQRGGKPATLATGSFDANTGIWVYEPQDKDEALNGMNELDVTNPPDADAEEEDWHFTTLLTGPDSEIKDLQFSPPWYGANLLATSSRDKSVWVWEEVDADNEWETVAVLGEHTGDVKCVGWCTGAKAQVGGENLTVGCREILASGSYDDTIRLWRDVEEEGDWVCVGVITGHNGTVWDLCWEGYLNKQLWREEVDVREWEGRILSCSDDMSLRIWRRELSEAEKEKKREKLRNTMGTPRQERLPSSIRPQAIMEKWVEEVKLPEVHVRSVYAVDWSSRTGLIVSCGGDGTIAVYREVLDETADVVMNGTAEESSNDVSGRKSTRWIVVATIEAAHDEYEVNHVCWSIRRDKDKRWEDEEIIVSTGDDGTVRLWTLPNDIIDDSWKTR